jgi:hypothetical protein
MVLSFIAFVASIIALRSKKLRRVRNGKYILILPVFVLLFG